MGPMPVPVAKMNKYGTSEGGASSIGNPLPITGLTSISAPAHWGELAVMLMLQYPTFPAVVGSATVVYEE